jgi:hypothetical protein
VSDTFQEIEVETEGTAREEDIVFQWRLEQLENAGYDQCSAIELAGRHDVDLHLALELRSRGCPAETAARILT